MAAGDGDVKLGTLGSGSESSNDGGSESPGDAGAAAEGGGWAAAALALLTGGGEMLLNVALVALVLLGAYRLWVRWGRRGLGAGAGAGLQLGAAAPVRRLPQPAHPARGQWESLRRDQRQQVLRPGGSIWNICW
uniref:cDNA FLJ34422 fis, clone HHDPC2005185, moderately similar to STEROID RECEPTOR PROTEIN DG6 n=1 Tax=Homo sapiens TaxID=9606 RepID=Q8NB07_HUMAN|nr:unnamed protein product [Homo sapiens]